MVNLPHPDVTDGKPVSPEPSGSAAPKPPSPGDGFVARVRNYAVDSYNGLYRLVLKPNMPSWGAILLVMVGVLIGLIWAWGIAPTIFYDADVSQLSSSNRDQYLKLVASAYDSNLYSAEVTRELLARVEDPGGNIARLANAATGGTQEAVILDSVRELANAANPGTPAPQPPGSIEALVPVLVPFLLVLILTPVIVLLWRMLIYPNLVQPAMKRVRLMRDAEYRENTAREQAEITRLKEMKAAAQKLQGTPAAEGSAGSQYQALYGKPVTTRLSIFNSNTQYDDSFEIELDDTFGNAFLGQCGSGVAEAVAPDAYAIDIWLFDMASQQNVSKLLVTSATPMDVMNRLRASVTDPANDIVVVTADTRVVLESQTIVLEALLTKPAFDARGCFAGFSMEIRAWQKKAIADQTVARPAAPSVPTAALTGTAPSSAPLPYAVEPERWSPAPPAMDPLPAAAPSYSPPGDAQDPVFGENRVITPPPAPFRTSQEDPFEGSGDFKPLSSDRY
jgi:hypothetical protein